MEPKKTVATCRERVNYIKSIGLIPTGILICVCYKELALLEKRYNTH